MTGTPPSQDGNLSEDEQPVSISSLRSKFESLAAGNASDRGVGAGFKGSTTGSNLLQRNINGGPSIAPKPGSVALGISASDRGSNAGSRPVTPSLPSVKPTPPQSPYAPPSRSSPSDEAVPAPPLADKPIIFSTPASPEPASPPARAPFLERRPSEPEPNTDGHPVSFTPLSPRHLRRPAPSVPLKPGLRSTSPALSDAAEDELPSGGSVKALRDRFAASSSSAAQAGPSRILTKSPSAGLDASRSSTPVQRQMSAPVGRIDATLAPETAVTGQSSLSSSPSQMETSLGSGKGRAPPPPPISRSNSPGPSLPAINRSSKPSSSRPSPAITPPATPGSRDRSPSLSQAEASPARPALPTRKATLPSPDLSQLAPPPLPGNKPRSDTLSARSGSADTSGPGPPKLPLRSRAQTISKSEDTRVGAPPPLPARSATLLVNGDAAPVGAALGRSGSLSHSPGRKLDRLSAGDYVAPPPPMRSSTISITSPPREPRSSAPPADFSSEDEEEEGPLPLTGLSSTAKRALEDTPDSTHANRRPPKFVPDVRMVQPHHIYAFAVFGRHVCTGAHHVRVYDTQMSEKPIFIVDLRETGLEFRIKEPRVTAMSFRPASHPSEEGRYLWCGTKDGHLWELDIMTGTVSDTKACMHGSAVEHIFRYKQNLLTLEESGKLHVFEVPTAEEKDSGLPPILTRTVRVSERSSFARMICGKLWTATAPTARSTTTTASKGATIRVYEPCAPGSMPPAKTLFTTEWTGAVTCATILPLKPDVVYLGHEGGFVSLWSSEDLQCLQVLKVSSSDILALEGVGEKLWAGNRKGQIHVYDVSEKPWQTTNVWTAHPDHSIHTLQVDPWSIEHSGRFTLWSTTRDAICAWDGLLSVDWIDSQMNLRQPEYCSFREVKALVCTWNIDSAKPTDLTGTNASFLGELLFSVDSPDIIVFGFQEVIPLTDKKLTAKTLLFGGKNKEAGATADKISSAYRNWLDKLTNAVRQAGSQDCQYIKVHSESLVGLFTCVFVKSDMKDSLRGVDICTVKRGIGGIYGNKGAIVARLILDDTSLCFINVHLAAGQSQKQARNADLGAIMEDKAILPSSDLLPFVHGGDGTAILDHELVILNGDLNYRIDQRRENVLSNISAGELSYLLEHDQLRKEMRGNHAFRLRSFDEAPITFAPTYKYNRGTDDYDSSEKRRIPAWCDRILYSKTDKIKTINYKRYETNISDHRPVSAGFALTVKAVDHGQMSRVRGDVGAEWAKRESEMLEIMSEAFKRLL